MITQKRLKQLLHYNPETGFFTWIARSSDASRVKIGEIVTTIHSKKHPYIICGIDGAQYKAHRLAFLYMTGRWPKGQVDHRNRNKSDNRWDNLRNSDYFTNARNKCKYSNNVSGHKGVSWMAQRNKWCAYINHDGVRHYLGLFDDIEKAAKAVRKKRKELHGEFARHA